MKKTVATALSLALVLGSGNITGSVFAATEISATTQVSTQLQQIKQFNDLKAMFTAETVSLINIKAKYVETIQPAVKAGYPEIDEKINFVLEGAIQGKMNNSQAKQAIDKGLQWFFYAEMSRLTKAVPDLLKAGKKTEASEALEQAIKLFEGSLQETTGKRDAKYGTGMKDLLNTVVVPGLRKSIADNDVLTYNLSRQMFDKTLIKMFTLATLTYAEKVPVETDAEKVKEQMIEAYFFYMPIFNSLKGGSQVNAEYIEKAFASGSKAQVKPTEIKAAFSAALMGKMTGYLQKTLKSMEAADLASAQVTAMEGNMFLAAQEILIKERLGADTYKLAENVAGQYFAAVKAGNTKDASTLGNQILKVVTNSFTTQEIQLQAFNELKGMFAEQTVSLTKIKSKYTETLQSTVKANYPEIDQNISFVLDASIAGKMTTGQAKQAVDKGLQWFFYAEMTRLTKSVPDLLKAGKKDEAKAALTSAIQLYEGSLKGSAEKRDVTFGTNMKSLLDTVVIPELQKAIEENNSVKYNVTRQMFDKTLIKVYTLATLTYVDKISKETDSEKVKEQMTEAYFFYMPISNSLKGGNKVDGEYIEKILASGVQKNVNVAKIKAAFAGAVNGKISSYYEKTLASLTKGDVDSAQVSAMEGNMFLAVEEILIKEKLGVDIYTSSQASAQKYFEAVKAKNFKEAKLQGFQVIKTVSNLDGVQFKLNTKSVTINGKLKLVTVAPFYHSKKKESFVSIRVASELLGWKISKNKVTKNLEISKSDIVYALQTNKNIVIKNGEIDKDIKLSQPLMVKNAINYVSVSTFNKLFGYKVFQSGTEIIIVK
jgi:hypothetical protein